MQPIPSRVTGKNTNQKPATECKPDPKVLKSIRENHENTLRIVNRMNGQIIARG